MDGETLWHKTDARVYFYPQQDNYRGRMQINISGYRNPSALSTEQLHQTPRHANCTFNIQHMSQPTEYISIALMILGEEGHGTIKVSKIGYAQRVQVMEKASASLTPIGAEQTNMIYNTLTRCPVSSVRPLFCAHTEPYQGPHVQLQGCGLWGASWV